GEFGGLAAHAVAELDLAVGETAADDDDGGHAQQLRVLELHAGADLRAVVEEDGRAGGVEGLGELLRGLRGGGVLVRDDHVHLVRGDGGGPAQAALVVHLLGQDGDQAGDADAVGAHGRAGALAVDVEDVDLEGVGVLAAQLEDVADLGAALQRQRALAVRGRVALADVGGLDGAGRGEVAAAEEVDDVGVGLVGADVPDGVFYAEMGSVTLPLVVSAD